MLSASHKVRRGFLDQPCWLDKDTDQPPTECRLRNITKSGGKLICPTPDKVPDEFNLYLTRDGKVGRKCSVALREGDEIEFNFISGIVQKSRWLPAALES